MMNAMVIFNNQIVAWYNYAVVIVLVPIGLFVFYKVFVRYKILRLGNNQIQIDYPMLRRSKIYPLDEVNSWTESKVKTGKNSEYKELQIQFADGTQISIGHKEHTEYTRMVQYLAQKVSKKKAFLS